MTLLRARLHPIWVLKVGYRYSVIFEGKLLVLSVQAIPNAMQLGHCWLRA